MKSLSSKQELGSPNSVSVNIVEALGPVALTKLILLSQWRLRMSYYPGRELRRLLLSSRMSIIWVAKFLIEGFYIYEVPAGIASTL